MSSRRGYLCDKINNDILGTKNKEVSYACLKYENW